MPGDDVRTSLVTIAALALLVLSGCAKEDAKSDGNGPDPSNTPSERDAAPGKLSETSPPSASPEDQTKDAAPADAQDDPPVNR
jgi:hypothetical protein